MWDDASALRRLTRLLLLVTILMLIGAAIAWVYNSHHFPVKQISIQGKLLHTDAKQLQSVARKYVRGNIFRADLNGAQEALQKMPWVNTALVRRRLPNTVEIVLEERVPVARWYDSGLVDTNGNIFQASVDKSLPVFEGQPGTGKDMVQHYKEFTGVLGPRDLKINKLIYTPRSAWSVELSNNITIRLGRENEMTRLKGFAEIWPSLLKKQQERLAYVDMRYKDGFAVRYSKPLDEPSENGSTQVQ